MRGVLLDLAACRKREYQAMVRPLSAHIVELELQYKWSHANPIYQELQQARAQILKKQDKRTKAKLFYEHGNQIGRFLAIAQQQQKASAMIHHICDLTDILYSKN